MSALVEAQAALSAAQAREQDVRAALGAAESRATSLRQQVATETSTTVTPSELANADDAVEHARLVLDGAVAAVPPLSLAVQEARADELCDEILREAPQRGAAVQKALDDIVAALVAFQEPALEYEQFVELARQRIITYGQTNARAKVQRNGPPMVDRFSVSSCRPASQLAAAILPTMRAVGTPQYQLEWMVELARAAPTIPTI